MKMPEKHDLLAMTYSHGKEQASGQSLRLRGVPSRQI